MATVAASDQNLSNHSNITVADSDQNLSNHSNITAAAADQNLSNHSSITVVDRQSFSNQNRITVNLYGTKITVTVTASGSVVDEWINTTLFRGRKFVNLRLLVVGMSIDPHVNTLQLCVGRRCLIFQLSHADYIPQNLRSFMLNYRCKFSGFLNNSHDIMLRFSKHQLRMYLGPLDLGWIDAAFDNCSVEQIIDKSLGLKVELKEEIRTSNWSEKILSDDQVLYACIETYCAFKMGIVRRVWHFASI